eukprot:INCI15858.2.p1 GENE.INCI15858.2~~INCI15858.2.p1  ORF type:complete len:243 (+),score=34.59 INCI15858.2:127-855(+)
MPRKPGQGMPGDGEVPLNNIKLVLSTLVAFHIPTKARDEARLTRTRTSIYRHEAESLERVFGGDGNDENDKERSRLLMATALLFDSDSSNTTQFVEFTLGIGNLRRNQGQLDLFGISVEQLDTNVAEYAEMLDTIKAILNPRAPRRSKSAEMLRNQYKRMSIHKGKILRTRSGALERGREDSANDSERPKEPVRTVDLSLLSEVSTDSEDDGANTDFAQEVVGRVLDPESQTLKSSSTKLEV